MKPITYSLSQFRGDLFGGLTAGVVALPLALAFGVIKLGVFVRYIPYPVISGFMKRNGRQA